MRLRRLTAPLAAGAALVLTAALAGCDAADAARGAPRGGTLSVRLRGTSAYTAPFDQTMSGQAISATVVWDGTPRLTIQLQDEGADPFELLTLAAFDTARPAPGTYAVTAGHEAGKLHADLSRSQDAPRFTEWFAVEGGTVTITAATAERIDGRLALTFRDGPHTATAEGTFTAVPGR